jgi:antitoxin component of MazEF toxin-antitoxin module
MNRKSSEKNTRKLVRMGKISLGLTIPKDILLELGWKEKQKVVVKKRGKSLIIEDWPQK